MKRNFIIYAPPFTNRSSGVRALYRLCHHLNISGQSAQMFVPEKVRSVPAPKILKALVTKVAPAPALKILKALFTKVAPASALSRTRVPMTDGWLTPFCDGPIHQSDIVIYPEVVSGNPLSAHRVVRWMLHEPGRLGGTKSFAKREVVFVYDRQKLPFARKATPRAVEDRHVLWTGLIDPAYIHNNGTVCRDLTLSFEHKGAGLQAKFKLDPALGAVRLEDLTPSYQALGEVLRRTRCLYSYDHYSNLLREAVLCGCEVRTIDAAGNWHDPRTCTCPENIDWSTGRPDSYAQEFESNAFVAGFLVELERAGLL